MSATNVASVDPGLTRSYRYLPEHVLGVPFYLVGAGMETGSRIATTRPRGGRGGQESVNVVAAGKHHGSPAIIVDIGTATTVEAVDDEANYLGGAVMTGVYVAIDALVARSAKLRA